MLPLPPCLCTAPGNVTCVTQSTRQKSESLLRRVLRTYSFQTVTHAREQPRPWLCPGVGAAEPFVVNKRL